MPSDFFDPTSEQQNVILVDAATLRDSDKLIESCEHRHPDDADIPFDWILDRVTGLDPSVTDQWKSRRSVRIVGGRLWKRLWLSRA